MYDKIARAFPQRVRAYMYRLFTAAVPIAIAYGAIEDETAPLWVGFGGALLAIGTASVNTSTKEPS